MFLPKNAAKKNFGINTKKLAKTVDIRLQSEYYITVARPYGDSAAKKSENLPMFIIKKGETKCLLLTSLYAKAVRF